MTITSNGNTYSKTWFASFAKCPFVNINEHDNGLRNNEANTFTHRYIVGTTNTKMTVNATAIFISQSSNKEFTFNHYLPRWQAAEQDLD